MTTTDNDIVPRVEAEINSRGDANRASYEYPGFIIIDGEFNTGDANDTWTVDRMNHDQSQCLDGRDTGIPTTSRDPKAIADAVLKAIDDMKANPVKRPSRAERVSLFDVQDLLARSLSVIEESDNADEHADLIRDLRRAVEKGVQR